MKKTIMLSLMTLLFSAASAYARPVDCEIANEVFCPLDLSQQKIRIDVHNSHQGYCGVKLVSNHNFIFAKLEKLTPHLKVSFPGGKGQIEHVGNTLLISNTEQPHLPHYFIVEMILETDDGRSLQELVSEHLENSSVQNIQFVALAVPCKQ